MTPDLFWQIALGILSGNVATQLGHQADTAVRTALANRKAKKEAERIERETKIAERRRVKARILKVGRFVRQLGPFGLMGHVELDGWEFAKDTVAKEHDHLPDGRCIFFGWTFAELVEVKKAQPASEADRSEREDDPDWWRRAT